MTDYERLETGLTKLDRAEALQYWSAYRKYGTTQKNPIDAIFDLIEANQNNQVTKTKISLDYAIKEQRKKEQLIKIKNQMEKIKYSFISDDKLKYEYDKINDLIYAFEDEFVDNKTYYGIGTLSIPDEEFELNPSYCRDVFDDVFNEINKQLLELKNINITNI